MLNCNNISQYFYFIVFYFSLGEHRSFKIEKKNPTEPKHLNSSVSQYL